MGEESLSVGSTHKSLLLGYRGTPFSLASPGIFLFNLSHLLHLSHLTIFPWCVEGVAGCLASSTPKFSPHVGGNLAMGFKGEKYQPEHAKVVGKDFFLNPSLVMP
ncbi:unnamed protein product [Victoria cruziana]